MARNAGSAAHFPTVDILLADNLSIGSAGAPVVGALWNEKETIMAEPQFSAHPDDDLPRTFRRDRDALQQRAALAAHRTPAFPTETADRAPGEGPGVTVTALDLPFFRLMAFLVKAVFAAVPALILLGALLYAAGQVLKVFFPWLRTMQIVVNFT